MMPSFIEKKFLDALEWFLVKCYRYKFITGFWQSVYSIFYNYLEFDDDFIPFTNYGYVHDEPEKTVAGGDIDYKHSSLDRILSSKQKQLKDRIPVELQGQWLSVNLYAVVLCQALKYGEGLDGKEFLEVGCGRGGGSLVVHAMCKPKRYTGVDLQATGIQRCRQLVHRTSDSGVTGKDLYKGSEVRFVEGNSMELDKVVAPNSFDIVLNVESSHCYPDLPMFLEQASTALKPGGYFLWCDARLPHVTPDFTWGLEVAGLKILANETITEKVSKALHGGVLEPYVEGYYKKVSEKNVLTRMFCQLCLSFFGNIAVDHISAGRLPYYLIISQKAEVDEAQRMRQAAGTLEEYKSKVGFATL
eukprot:GHVQ01003862.1.p1 GENE.GHVQ01003862.1~~GHVQ01003862.1.p1  ORF type:complete len:359 (+),score=29.42 GHVQ01003862.1:1393-2469(+)